MFTPTQPDFWTPAEHRFPGARMLTPAMREKSGGTLVPVTATLPGLRMGGFVSRYLSAVASLGLGGESWTQTSIYYVPNVVSYH